MKNSNEMKLKFRITNSSNLIAFLKKIKLVDKSVILELEGTQFFAKVRTADKSVIKYVSIDTYNFLEGEVPKGRVKIGIMEINKIIDAFKYFGPEEETYIDITAQPVDKDVLATSLKLYSKSLNISIRCADINLVTYMDDAIQKAIHAVDGALVYFPVTKEAFNKIVSLSGMENNAQELLNFDVYANRLVVRGNSFEYNLIRDSEISGYSGDATYTIYKNQFSSIDQENSMFYIEENRIIVLSEETDSKIAIGRVEME
jgi:hypothetical protein